MESSNDVHGCDGKYVRPPVAKRQKRQRKRKREERGGEGERGGGGERGSENCASRGFKLFFKFRFKKGISASTAEHRTAVKISLTGVVRKQSRGEKVRYYSKTTPHLTETLWVLILLPALQSQQTSSSSSTLALKRARLEHPVSLPCLIFGIILPLSRLA